MIFFAALLTGVLGGLHCIAMCGPLVLMITGNTRQTNAWVKLGHMLLYNAGRILSYVLLGGIVGMSGRGLTLVSSQQALSLTIGLLVLMSIFLSVNLRKHLNLLQFSHRLSIWVRRRVLRGKISGTYNRNFIFGIFNGFLPCGTVYLALAGALATGSIADGMLYMFIFGLGTLPFLLVVKIFGQIFRPDIPAFLHKKMLFVFTLSLAGLLIIRALNLGIPYLSPKIVQGTAEIECCEPLK